MWQYIEESHRELLQQNGLSQFRDFMTFRGGKVLKQLPSRTIIRTEFQSGEGKKSFFLKRHHSRLRIGEIIRALCSGFPLSWGKKEWEVIHSFMKIGIPTLTPVAAGEDLTLHRQESFLMTEELTGFISLEMFLKSRFIPPLSRDMIPEKRSLIRELAHITRTMHRAGFNHRDFYCCHIFIRLLNDGQRDWRVLDLQRVDWRRWFRKRWIIKDLAALNYSAPVPMITRTDRLRFIKHYLAIGDTDRRLIRQIIRKTRRISRHDQKLQERKRSQGQT